MGWDCAKSLCMTVTREDRNFMAKVETHKTVKNIKTASCITSFGYEKEESCPRGIDFSLGWYRYLDFFGL